MGKDTTLEAREQRVVIRRIGIPQPGVHGMFWRVTTVVLVTMAGACSSESDGSASGSGGAASTPDGSVSGSAGMNSAGASGSSGASGVSGSSGSSAASSQGGNATGAGGVSSAGSSGTSGGGASSGTGGGTNIGGAIISGGRPGAGGGSSGAAGSAGACTAVGAPCNPDTDICCTGAVCVVSTSPDQAGCREDCTTAADCASGCCIPFSNLPNKGFCGAATMCQCAGQGETCGGTRQCCSGFSCSTFDASGALACHPTCTQNSDCSTNCCVTITGTPDSVCLPAKPWCGG